MALTSSPEMFFSLKPPLCGTHQVQEETQMLARGRVPLCFSHPQAVVRSLGEDSPPAPILFTTHSGALSPMDRPKKHVSQAIRAQCSHYLGKGSETMEPGSGRCLWCQCGPGTCRLWVLTGGHR